MGIILQSPQWLNFDVPFALWSVLDQRGTEYIAAPRPKGFRRQRSEGYCFGNAALIVLDHENATYVEGAAWSPSCRGAVHHAWVTLDGKHAVDPTWPYDPATIYIGITVARAVVLRAVCLKSYRGDPILAPQFEDAGNCCDDGGDRADRDDGALDNAPDQ
jgi:hypothetical protein